MYVLAPGAAAECVVRSVDEWWFERSITAWLCVASSGISDRRRRRERDDVQERWRVDVDGVRCDGEAERGVE